MQLAVVVYKILSAS